MRANGRQAALPCRREADFSNGAYVDSRTGSQLGPNECPGRESRIAAAASQETLSGVNMLHQAMAVAAAADAYSARGRPNISALTLRFLLSRSLELALKAYLMYMNCAEERLREMGQDLSALLEQATAHSFEFRGGTSDADRQAVAALAASYMPRWFEHPPIATQQSVAPRVLREIVHRAIAAVFVAIWNEDPLQFNLRRTSDRALGLSIADDACYEESPVAALPVATS